MKPSARSLFFACLFVLCGPSLRWNLVIAQTSQVPRVTVTRESGGSIQTPLSSGIVVNKESSLTREWITFHDPLLPADVLGTIGVKTVYESGRVSGDYKYSAKFTIDAREPISAIEVRFLLFDLWGEHIKTLSLSEVADIQGSKEVSGRWRVYSENEVSEYYASIGFIARVRTQSGRVFQANTIPVLEEARKFSKKFTAESLEPKPEKP